MMMMLSMMNIYSRRVLRLSSGIDEMGSLMWDLSLSLVLAWTITFLALIKGIKSSGKVRRTSVKYVLQFQQDSCAFPLGCRVYIDGHSVRCTLYNSKKFMSLSIGRCTLKMYSCRT